LSQEKTASSPFIIPIFLPHHGCPHHCAFCNQNVITGKKHAILSPVKAGLLIDNFLKYNNRQGPVQIAFYGGTFLGLKVDYIKSLLCESTKFIKDKKVDSIRFSTRPDTIDNNRLDLIDAFPISTIELGVQSMDDQVLADAKRGHTSQDTVNAFELLKERDYKICAQMMVGLPGDDEIGALTSAMQIVDLAPDFVRIYPAVVLAGSLLAKWYQSGAYQPVPIEDCVTLVKKLFSIYEKRGIKVIRMGLQASQELDANATVIAGPYHPAFGHLVYSEIFFDRAVKAIELKKNLHDTITIKVHPKSISKMIGLKRRNIKKLKSRYDIKSVNIMPDAGIGVDDITLLT